MESSLLFDTLRLLSKEERAEVRAFLQAMPVVRNRGIAIVLFDFLEKNHFQPETAPPDLASTCEQLGYDQRTIANSMTELMRVLRKWVAFNAIYGKEENQFETQLTMTRFYRERGDLDRFGQSIKGLEKISNNEKLEPDTYYHKFLLEQERFLATNFYNNRMGDANLLPTIISLDRFYFSQRLHYGTLLLRQRQVVVFDEKGMGEASNILFQALNGLEHIEGDHFLEIQRKVYAAMLQKWDVPEEDMLQLKQLVENNEAKLPPVFLVECAAHFRNYYATAYQRSGNIQFLQKLFAIQQAQLPKGFLYYNGGLMPMALQNLVNTALLVGPDTYEWLENCVKNHELRIVGTEYPTEIYRLMFAKVRLFRSLHEGIAYEETYAEVNRHLRIFDGSGCPDPFLRNQHNLLRLQVEYYRYADHARALSSPMVEQDEFDKILESYRAGISRTAKGNSLPTALAEGFKNFVQVLKKIKNPKTYCNKERIEKIEKEIVETPLMHERVWLLGILKDLGSTGKSA